MAIGTETDRGPWVSALVAAGYTVYGVNPLQACRYPAKVATLTRAQISAALKRARRRDIPGKAAVILAVLGSAQLGQPTAVTNAYAVTVRSLVAVIIVLNEQVKTLQGQVEADFGRHPDAEIYLSQPGMGPVLGALYDTERASGTGHNPALRKLASRLVGIRHGCLKTRTLYDEATAWPHREKTQSDIALDT